MKLHLVDRSSLTNSSFNTKRNTYPYFLKIWHYHPNLELVAVLKSTGTCFVGDGIEKFEKGDVVLIGENIPHMWLNDEAYFQKDSELVAEAAGVHFEKDFLGKEFFETPEMIHILELLTRARYGVKFINAKQELIDEIVDMMSLEGFEKTMSFIKILHKLAKQKDYKLLSSQGFLNSFQKTENKALDKIYEYIFKNFAHPISLTDVAGIANMNPSAFSRFFKRVNRKPFSRYLNEIRIGYACKLLIEQKQNIASICYESGFNNVSNFNRQFKLIIKMSPSEYVQQHDNK